jgi:putative ABC transport system ATP-binding protein
MAVILDRVSKQYGTASHAVRVLQDLSLQIPTGEFVSIMGPSGSGKSTLLNLVAGLDTPTSGRIVLSGQDLGGLSDDARSDLRLQKIGFVFQAFNLFSTFSVEENVTWPLEFSGVDFRSARQRAADLLDQLKIPATARRRRPAELSGGEQQRVSIARALATQPEILLADEPTGNLDSRSGEAILDLLRALNGERRLTVILVTHSTFAATYGERTVELRDGRIERDVRAAPPGTVGRVIPLRD